MPSRNYASPASLPPITKYTIQAGGMTIFALGAEEKELLVTSCLEQGDKNLKELKECIDKYGVIMGIIGIRKIVLQLLREGRVEYIQGSKRYRLVKNTGETSAEQPLSPYP